LRSGVAAMVDDRQFNIWDVLSSEPRRNSAGIRASNPVGIHRFVLFETWLCPIERLVRD